MKTTQQTTLPSCQLNEQMNDFIERIKQANKQFKSVAGERQELITIEITRHVDNKRLSASRMISGTELSLSYLGTSELLELMLDNIRGQLNDAEHGQTMKTPANPES